MNRWRVSLFALLGIVAVATSPHAQNDIKPAIVYANGGKFDKSFNESVSEGAQRFTAETQIAVAEFEPSNEAQFEQALRRFAQRGQDPIIAVSYAQATAVGKVAKEFPNTRFTLIDSKVDLPNVQSILFKEHEGSFMVGIAAAMTSRSGKVGFIGGMDIPLIRRFWCGYLQGAKYAVAKTDIVTNMAGTTPAAWTDPGRGAELAKGQFDRGVDVVFAAAGQTGIGVLQAAADRGKYSIGVDSNQDRLHPGSVLTSMVKRVDIATYQSFKTAQTGNWVPGANTFGLKEGGVDWTIDEYNQKLFTDAIREKGRKARIAINGGNMSIHDYMEDNKCSD